MIREQIAEIIRDYKYEKYYDSNEAADTILALPSGLEAVRKCIDHTLQEWDLVSDTTKCVDCHGTGDIVRDLTVREVNELPKMILEGKAKSKYYLVNAVEHRYIELPSGERVRVKKDK